MDDHVQEWIEGEFNSILASLLGFVPSLDHIVRSRQHIRRNRQAHLLGGLKVDHQLKFRRLLHREIFCLSEIPSPSASNPDPSALSYEPNQVRIFVQRHVGQNINFA